MKILIDPGHGGNESGCCGFGKLEKDLNLKYALSLKDELSKYIDTNIKMTRTTDIDLGINERIKIISLENPDLIVSCHLNEFDEKSRGTETIHSIFAKQVIINLATELAKNISNGINVPFRRVFSQKSEKGNWDYFGVIRASPKTIIIEPLFLDNKQDSIFIFENDWNLKLSKIILETIARHYKLQPSKQGKVFNVTSNLNVRSGSSINFKIIGNLKNDSIVKIYSLENNFYKISFGTGFGYVSKDYIKII